MPQRHGRVSGVPPRDSCETPSSCNHSWFCLPTLLLVETRAEAWKPPHDSEPASFGYRAADAYVQGPGLKAFAPELSLRFPMPGFAGL
jgi:hypothetical protein